MIKQTSILLFSLLLWTMTSMAQSLQISASATSGCAPLAVTFSANQTSASYNWTFSNGSSSSSSNPVIVFTTAGTYSVTLTLANGNTATAQNLVTVSGIPSPQMSVDTNSTCKGNPIQFTTQGAAGSTFYWDMGDGTVLSGTNVSHTYAQSGIYSIAIQETSNGGCIGANSFPNAVTILNTPTANITKSIPFACSPTDTVTFTSSSSGMSNYQWKINNSTIPESGQSFSHVFSSSGAYTIKLTVTNANGCSSYKESVFNVFNPIYPVYSNPSYQGCEPYTFSETIAGQGFNSVLWTSSDGNTATGNSANIVFNAEGVYEIFLTANDPNGCALRDTIDNINVLETPNASFTLNDSIFCDSANIIGTSNVNGAQNYWWKFGESTLAGNSINHLITEPGSYHVTHGVTLMNGCSDSIFSSDLIKVESGKPLNNFTSRHGCIPCTSSFEHNNVSLIQEMWISSTNDTAYGDQVSFSYPAIGSYDITFIGESQHGCKDTTLFENAVITTEGTINFNGPSIQTYCEPKNVTFNGTLIGNSQFTWDFGDGTTSSDSVASHLFDSAGVFVVGITSENNDGCPFHIDTHSIIRISDITADFSHQVISCSGRTVAFTAIAQNVITYDWHLGGFSTFDQNPTHTFSSGGPFDISLNVYDSLGCDANITKANLLDFTDCIGTGGSGLGNTDPGGNGFPTGTAQDPLFEGCAPFNIFITNPYDSVQSVIWYFGDGDTSHVFNPTHQYDSAGYYDLSIVKTNLNNETDSIVIEYFAYVGNPISQFSIEEFSTCQGSVIDIDNQSINATNWITLFGDGDSSAVENASHTYDSTGYFTVQLIAKDDIGCSNTSFQLVSANFPNPDLDLNNSLCGNDSTTIMHNIDHFSVYEWHIGDSIIIQKHPEVYGLDTGTYNIWLNGLDSNGCGTTLFDPTFLTITSPFASFNLPTGNIACDEVEGLINNTSYGANSYKWYQDSNLFSVNATPYIDIEDTGTYIFKLIAKRGQCSSTLSQTLVVTEAVADFQYSVSSYCLPASASFTDMSVGATSWQWGFGNNISSIIQNPVINYSANSAENIVLNILDSNGCQASKELPAIDFHHVYFSPSALQGCIPLDVTMQDTVGSSTSYNWSFSNGNSAVGNNAVSTFSNGGYYSITLTAGHSSGCSTTLTYDSIIHVADPQADFSLLTNGYSCAPLLAEFQNNSIDAISSRWLFGDGFISNAESPQHFYLTPDTFDVTLIVTGLYNCKDTAFQPELIKVSGPVAEFELNAPNICLGDTLFLINNSKRSSEYTWMFGDGTLSNDFEPYHVYTTPGNYDIVLSVLDSGQCFDLSVLNNFQVKETPIPNPTAKQLGNCIPVTVEVSDASQYAINPTMTWTIGDEVLTATSDSILTITESGAHSIHLLVKNSNGCSADTLLTNKIIAYDTTDESTALLRSLSVNDSGRIHIAYDIQPHDNFISHELYQYNHGNSEWKLIREGNELAFAAESSLSPGNDRSSCFKLKKINHCVLDPSMSSIKPHCSIYAEIKEKNNERIVTWSPLENASFSAYSIEYKGSNDVQFQEIGRADPAKTSFTDESALCPEKVEYRVLATDLSFLGDDAVSNASSIVVDTLPSLRKAANIDLATILEDESILIQWKPVDLPPHLIDQLELHKMVPGRPTVIYELNQHQTDFIDYETDVQQEYASYHIEIHNACEVLPLKGTPGNTILLQKNQDGLEVELQWNPYEEWDKGVKEYQIQKLNEFGEWEIIKRISPEENSTKIDLTE